MKQHVLTETSYCASMFEHPKVGGRYRCSAAGCYIDTDGGAICASCAAGRVVVKLTELPKLVDLVDQISTSKDPLTDDLRARLRALVAVAPEDFP